MLLTPNDVAQVLRIPARSVLHLVRLGHLHAIILPGRMSKMRRVRIEQDALEEFLGKHRTPTEASILDWHAEHDHAPDGELVRDPDHPPPDVEPEG